MVARRRFLQMFTASLLTPIVSRFAKAQTGVSLDGQVLTVEGNPIPNARVTVFSSYSAFFQEVRTDATGYYHVATLPTGTYQLGVSALGREYQEISVSVSDNDVASDFSLDIERHQGEWNVIGSTEPETFGGTNSGSVLPDGRIFYCHDAVHPILFDPTTGETRLAAMSSSEQGCHMPTHIPDGRLLIIGGGTVDDDGNFGDSEQAVATVKVYDPLLDRWENWPSLSEPRWYPGLARLADGKLLLFGGGQQPDRLRTDSCEILDPETQQSVMTGSLLRVGGFGPAILLLTGEVLLTWEPPQLYNPVTGQWRATGDFVQPNRAEVRSEADETNPTRPRIGDHPDHSALMLPDGRVVIIGIRRPALGPTGSMVEVYDPSSERWSLLSSPESIRSMPNVLMLPTGKILVAGGKQEVLDSPDPVNEWGQLKRVDLYDPHTDTWRRMMDMGDFREYHAIMLLLPDGRVIITAGVDRPGYNPPENSNKNIEAFSPPYMFRGIRPQIERLSSTQLTHGQMLTIDVSFTSGVTNVVLIGLRTNSHWMNGGVSRLVEPSFEQTGSLDGRTELRVNIPSDMVEAPTGYYILFVFVDDIPSVGQIVYLG